MPNDRFTTAPPARPDGTRLGAIRLWQRHHHCLQIGARGPTHLQMQLFPRMLAQGRHRAIDAWAPDLEKLGKPAARRRTLGVESAQGRPRMHDMPRPVEHQVHRAERVEQLGNRKLLRLHLTCPRAQIEPTATGMGNAQQLDRDDLVARAPAPMLQQDQRAVIIGQGPQQANDHMAETGVPRPAGQAENAGGMFAQLQL